MLLATTNAFFVGTVAQADYQFATAGRTGTTHTGTIYCPANEEIEHFELAFDTSAAARANVPYDLIINGNKIYSNSTPGVLTSGYHAFATTTPINHDPVPCYGQATWVASSTVSNSIRIYYTNINTGSYQAQPNIQLSEARNVSLYLASNPTDQNVIGGRFRFSLVPYYLSTSTPSGGGGGDSYTVNTLDPEVEKTFAFLLLLCIYVIPLVLFVYLMRQFYDRK